MLSKIKLKYQEMPLLARASIWFVVCSFFQKGISVLTTPIFTRLMNTSEYGQFNIFNSWYGIVEVFVSLELAKGVYAQGIIKFSDEQKVFSSSFQGLNLLLCIVWTAIYLLFHDFFNQLLKLSTVQMLCMLAMIWATAAFELWATEKRTFLEYRPLVILTIFTSLLKPMVGIILVLHSSDKVTARILGLTLVEVAAYTGTCIVQIIRGKKIIFKKHWIYALKFNLPLIPHYLAQIVLSSSDRLMIGSMVNDAAAGIYGVGYSLAIMMGILGVAFHKVAIPWIYKRIKANDIGNVQPMSMILFIIIGIANLLLIAFTPEGVRIFAPASYHDAIRVVPPVALSEYFMFMYSFFACFEFYFEKRIYSSIASIIGAILNIILNALLIPVFGYIAAAYTTLFCNLLYVIAHFCLMRLVCKKYMNGKAAYGFVPIFKVSLIMTAMSVLITLTYSSTMVRYSLLTVVAIVLFTTRKKWMPLITGVISTMREKTE